MGLHKGLALEHPLDPGVTPIESSMIISTLPLSFGGRLTAYSLAGWKGMSSSSGSGFSMVINLGMIPMVT